MDKAQKKCLPDVLGKTWNVRLVSVYSKLWKQTYGFEYKANYGMLSKMFGQLIDQYDEYQIASLLVVFFNWHGVSGEDEWEFKRLANSAFNVTWFVRGINQYEVYLRNVLGVNMDDLESLSSYLKDNRIL